MKKLLSLFVSCLLVGCASSTYIVKNCINEENST